MPPPPFGSPTAAAIISAGEAVGGGGGGGDEDSRPRCGRPFEDSSSAAVVVSSPTSSSTGRTVSFPASLPIVPAPDGDDAVASESYFGGMTVPWWASVPPSDFCLPSAMVAVLRRSAAFCSFLGVCFPSVSHFFTLLLY